MGAALGLVGGLLPNESRAVIAIGLGGLALAVGTLELNGRRFSLPQHSCETPQRWIHRGALRWAIRNGLTLGAGVWTRLGFWSWYLVPLSALLIAEPFPSAVVYGSYGLGRGVAAWGLIALFAVAQRSGEPRPAVKVLERRELATRIGAAQLLGVGAIILVAFGL